MTTEALIYKKRMRVSQRFKLGLRDPELRQAMTASRDSSLSSMKAHCIEMEKLQKQRKPKLFMSSPSPNRKFVTSENFSRNTRESENFSRNTPERRSLERLSFKPPTDYTSKTDQKGCTYCNHPGHEVKDCWKKDKDDGVICTACNAKGHREQICKKNRVHFVEIEDDNSDAEAGN